MDSSQREARRIKRNRRFRCVGGPLDGRVLESQYVCDLGFPPNHIQMRIKEPALSGSGAVENRQAIVEYHYDEYRNAHVFQRIAYLDTVE